MSQKQNLQTEHSYISCLMYLAAEAEREKNYVIAEILKSATASICHWAETGDTDNIMESNELIESLTAAFLFALRHRSLSQDKKELMISLINEIERGKLN
jgi:hypothetical protein